MQNMLLLRFFASFFIPGILDNHGGLGYNTLNVIIKGYFAPLYRKVRRHGREETYFNL